MMHVLKRAWDGVVLPILQRPNRLQVAALCFREGASGKEVLLVTSRDTGRWILPKGWPIDGMNAPQAALQEAWEEAGVSKASIEDAPLGTYDYAKGLEAGGSCNVTTLVYKTRVHKTMPDYPEADQRKREWVPPMEAASRVDEPELKAILQTL